MYIIYITYGFQLLKRILRAVLANVNIITLEAEKVMKIFFLNTKKLNKAKFYSK